MGGYEIIGRPVRTRYTASHEACGGRKLAIFRHFDLFSASKGAGLAPGARYRAATVREPVYGAAVRGVLVIAMFRGALGTTPTKYFASANGNQ